MYFAFRYGLTVSSIWMTSIACSIGAPWIRRSRSPALIPALSAGPERFDHQRLDGIAAVRQFAVDPGHAVFGKAETLFRMEILLEVYEGGHGRSYRQNDE